MPSLIDLYNQRKPRSIDLGNVGSIIADNPTGLLTGALELIPSTLKGLASSAGKIAQSISPVQLPFVDAQNQGTDLGGRAEQLLSGATLGVYDQAKQHYQDSGSLTSAAGQTVYDLLPIDEALSIVSGKDAQGNQLTSEQLSQQLIQGVLEAIPVAKGLSGVKGALRKNVPDLKVGRSLRTNNEIQQFMESFAKGEATKETQSLLQTIQKQRSAAPIVEGIDDATRKPEGRSILSDRQLQQDMDAALGNDALMKAIVPRLEKHLLDENKPQYFARAYAEEIKGLMDDGIDPAATAHAAQALGLDLGEVANSLVERADQWVKAGQSSSRVLNIIREFSQSHKSYMREVIEYSKKFSNDPEVLAKLQRASEKLGPTTIYHGSGTTKFKYYGEQWEGTPEPDRLTTVQSEVVPFPSNQYLRTWVAELDPIGVCTGTLFVDNTVLATATFSGSYRQVFRVGLDVTSSLALQKGQTIRAVYNSTTGMKHYNTNYDTEAKPFGKQTWAITYKKIGGASQVDMARFWAIELEVPNDGTATITSVWDIDGEAFSTNTLTFTGREWRDRIAFPPGARGYLFQQRLYCSTPIEIYKSTLDIMQLGVKGLVRRSIEGLAK